MHRYAKKRRPIPLARSNLLISDLIEDSKCGIGLNYRGFSLTGTGTEVTEQSFRKEGKSLEEGLADLFILCSNFMLMTAASDKFISFLL